MPDASNEYSNGQLAPFTDGQMAPLPSAETNAENLLSLKDIATNLNVKYDRLRGFADAHDVKKYIGAVNVAGVKGVRYPPDAQDLFSALIQEQDRGLIEPGTAGAWLARRRTDRIINGQSVHLPEATNRPMAELPKADIMEAIKGVIKEAASELLEELTDAGRLPEPDDELLTASEVAAILKCAKGSVRSFVLPVRRGRWRRSDVMRYIRQLG